MQGAGSGRLLIHNLEDVVRIVERRFARYRSFIRHWVPFALSSGKIMWLIHTGSDDLLADRMPGAIPPQPGTQSCGVMFVPMPFVPYAAYHRFL